MKIADTLPAVKSFFSQGLDKAKAKFSTLSAPDLSALRTKKAGAGVIAALVTGTIAFVGFKVKTGRWEQFKTDAKKAVTAAKNKVVAIAKNPKAQKAAATVATLAVGAGIVVGAKRMRANAELANQIEDLQIHRDFVNRDLKASTRTRFAFPQAEAIAQAIEAAEKAPV